MKTCTKCLIGKEKNSFSPDKRKIDLLQSQCRICQNKDQNKYHKTKKGVLKVIYGNQRISSRERQHIMPTYNLEDLRAKYVNSKLFNIIYNNRVKSWYIKDLIPSIDRLDDNKSYSLDNIQLMTWAENKAKSHRDMRNGKLKHWHKPQKSVIGVHKITGEKIVFISISKAGRHTWISKWNISQCCNCKCKTAWWYIWKFN